MKYTAPDFRVELFQLNANIADGCDRVVTGTSITTTYPAQSVTCAIGGQNEVIFTSGTSGCSTAASKYALGYYDLNNDGTNEYYFCWYAPDEYGGGIPSEAQKALMASVAGVSDARGWHYCQVISQDIVTNILGFSY